MWGDVDQENEETSNAKMGINYKFNSHKLINVVNSLKFLDKNAWSPDSIAIQSCANYFVVQPYSCGIKASETNEIDFFFETSMYFQVLSFHV